MSTSMKRNNSNKRKETEVTQEIEKTEKRAKINDSITIEGILSFFLLRKINAK